MNCFRLLPGLVLLPLALLAAGCRSFEASLNTYLATEAQGLTLERIALVPNQDAENPLLDAELRDRLAALLEERGIQTVAPEEAVFGLLASTSLSDPTSTSLPTPLWQPGGTFFAQVGTPNGTAITPVRSFGPTYVPGSTVRYAHQLSLLLFELDTYRSTGELKPLWVGEARHFGRSSDLRSVARTLAIALIDYIGTDTGREVRVRVDD